MMYLGIILTGCVIGLVVGLMSPESEKPYKRKKKNFFVRLGETGDPVHFPK